MKNFFSGQISLGKALFSLSLRVIGALALYSMNVVIARKLGANEAGIVLLGITFLLFLSSIGRCGLERVVLRFCSISHAQNLGVQYRSILMFSIGLTSLACGILSIAVWLGADSLARFQGKPGLAPVLRWLSIGLIAVSANNLVAMSLQAQGRIVSTVVLLQIATAGGVSVALLFASLNSAELVSMVFSSFAWLTFLLGLLYWFFVNGVTKKISIKILDRSRLIGAALPLWVIVTLSQTIQWSGQIVAGFFVSNEELAQLVVAQRTAMLTTLALFAVNLVVAPSFASLYERRDICQLRRTVSYSVRMILLMAMPVAIILVTFPNFFMSLFGTEFSAGAVLLQILVVGQVINVATGSVGNLLTMAGFERDLRNALLIVAPLSIIVGVAMAYEFGVVGCAISTSFAVALENILAAYWVKKRLGFNLFTIWKSNGAYGRDE